MGIFLYFCSSSLFSPASFFLFLFTVLTAMGVLCRNSRRLDLPCGCLPWDSLQPSVSIVSSRTTPPAAKDVPMQELAVDPALDLAAKPLAPLTASPRTGLPSSPLTAPSPTTARAWAGLGSVQLALPAASSSTDWARAHGEATPSPLLYVVGPADLAHACFFSCCEFNLIQKTACLQITPPCSCI